ncbi:hypothetical protein DYB37_010098 [Aphanomyces astaci]|uniref:Uncharacterized protein n=1 Tax=Aphanomyces astaci TaxID=112090 RepID=A0A418F5V6_APHAT|nr:hypothetical protein DYB37_010098 [Aphanomyces astaci]
MPQRFCHRHGFSRQRPTKNKVKKADLAEVQSDFAAEFHREYIAYGKECVYNADETCIYYDMPAGARFGRCEEEVPKSRAWRSIRFALRRSLRGELSTFPPGHYYAVQERARMD